MSLFRILLVVLVSAVAIIVGAVAAVVRYEPQLAPDFAFDPKVLVHSKMSAARLSILIKRDNVFGHTDFGWKHSNSLRVTGTYTDKSGMPTGLFVSKGDVINAKLKNWDGILTVDREGVPRLFPKSRVVHLDVLYDLSKPTDLKKFLSVVEQTDLSVLQSHMIVIDGESDVNKRKGAAHFQRRAYVQFEDGAWAIIDSLDQKETLYDFSKRLETVYKVTSAINLDMGAYDYCEIVAADSFRRACGLLKDDAILTNVLQVDF